MGILSALGVVVALGLVLAVLAIAMRLLKSYVGGASGTGRGSLRVLRRLPLGPRQGLAVVALGQRTLVVSVGEGGVRAVAELDEEERAALDADPGPDRQSGGGTPALDFGTILRQALPVRFGRGGSALLLVTLGAALTLTSIPARAQAPAPGASPAIPGIPGQPPAPQPTGQPARGVLGGGGLRSSQQPVAVPPASSAIARPGPGDVGGGTGALTANPAGPGVGAPSSIQAIDQRLGQAAPSIDLRMGGGADQGGLRLSGSVGVVVMMGLLTMLPTLVLMMTGFARILIVLHFLKQAIGTQAAPPAQLVAGLAMVLTGFVMMPTLSEANRTAIDPWMEGKIEQVEMLKRASVPFREFMLRQTRDADLEAFVSMAHLDDEVKTVDDVPLVVVMTAFVTSELRTAFQIGFAIFLPFIIIDLVVASVLMSMGMFMLPPAMISLPFKLLLFVLVDGWTLVCQGLVESFK